MLRRAYYRGRDFRRAVSIEELRRVAHRCVPRFAMEYLEGGAEDEITLHRNRSVFERIAFLPRTLVDVKQRDSSTELFGQKIKAPMVIAPTALNGLLRHGADLGLAKAAAGAGIPFTLSTLATIGIEDLVSRAGGQVWFQIYNMSDREFWKKLVGRADRAGCPVLVITSDAPVYGNREWDGRNYAAPTQLSLRSKLEILRHPRWFFEMARHGQPRFENLKEIVPDGDTRVLKAFKPVTKLLDPTLNWEDIRMLRDLWPRKLVVKGIMTKEDALRAVELGADGIVLSNHGGRQLDGAVSPMQILPEVVAAAGSRITILIDSGFRRGTDVAKAVALGAKAVMIGRPTLYGIGAGGEPGAAHALAILRQELDRAMALLGCNTIAEIGPHLLHAPHTDGRP